jgi:hypothetical protein
LAICEGAAFTGFSDSGDAETAATLGSEGTAGATFFGGSWNQLFLQFAQRTWRPFGPTALSGTT